MRRSCSAASPTCRLTTRRRGGASRARLCQLLFGAGQQDGVGHGIGIPAATDPDRHGGLDDRRAEPAAPAEADSGAQRRTGRPHGRERRRAAVLLRIGLHGDAEQRQTGDDDDIGKNEGGSLDPGMGNRDGGRDGPGDDCGSDEPRQHRMAIARMGLHDEHAREDGGEYAENKCSPPH
jgi:hypothetical protein